MAQDNSSSINQYPYTIIPQFRNPAPPGTQVVLKCPPDYSLQSIILDGANLAVVRGYEWKSKFELGEFYTLCDSYMETELIVPNLLDQNVYDYEMAHIDGEDFVRVSFPMMKNIKFVCIFPLYHNLNEVAQPDWHLNWRYTGESEWRHLGKIFMMDATLEKPIPEIQLQNLMGEDIYVKIMVAN